MNKFIIIVPHIDKNSYKISTNYTDKIAKFSIPYCICDYNINNIDITKVLGIILTGGADINPNIYGQKNSKSYNISDRRDSFEIELIKLAFENKIPILAICRGIQILNVAFGGDLYQDIPYHMQQEKKHIPTHSIDINKNSMLYKIIDKNKISVNSLHHQAIKTVAKDFKVVARNGDIVEAIEYAKDDRFIMGVQWHPEALEDIYSDRLFSHFLNIK